MLKKIIGKIKKKGLFNTILFIIGSILYKITRIFFDAYLKKLKVKNNTILFASTPDYSDNAKALYDYMLNTNQKNYKYVWLVNDNKKYNTNENTIFVRKTSNFHSGPTLKSLYYASTSKITFYTHSSPLKKINPKPEQLIINLWHGCGYKSKEATKKSYIEDNYFDYVLVPGKIFIKNKAIFFGCQENQVLDIGYPRYDVLISENKETKIFVNNLKKDNKLIVWMPTFRKTLGNEYPEEKIKRNYDLPILSSNNDLIDLNNVCKKNNIELYIKRHPFQVEYLGEKENLSNIHFINQEFFTNNSIDLYSFLHYTDGLITDYSSISVDYLLLDKPIAYTLDDFESYSNLRGFTFENPKEYMPGHHLCTYNELVNYIDDVSKDNDIYNNKRKEKVKELHNKCDNYCKRIIEKINDL